MPDFVLKKTPSLVATPNMSRLTAQTRSRSEIASLTRISNVSLRFLSESCARLTSSTSVHVPNHWTGAPGSPLRGVARV